MDFKKKLIRLLHHPFESACMLIRFLINRPRFRDFHLSTYIADTEDVTCRYVSLSRGVYIGKRCRIEGITQYNDKSFTPSIEFGECATVRQNLYLTCANYVSVGKNTAIAAYVTITDIDHPYDDISKPIERQDIQVGEVVIGEDCKIYNGAVILRDTHIGRHCTIGANAVVRGDFPDFSVIVGAPARVIKRFNHDTNQGEKTGKHGTFLTERK